MNRITFSLDTSDLALEGGVATLVIPNLLVDGEPVVKDAYSTPLDITHLLARQADDGEFDLYTCSCGVAGCAGFTELVRLTGEDAAVRLSLPEVGYGQARDYVFDRVQYLEALADVRARLLALAAARPVQLPYDDYGPGLADVRPLQELLQGAQDWHDRCQLQDRVFRETFSAMHDQDLVVRLVDGSQWRMSTRQFIWAREADVYPDENPAEELAARWAALAGELRLDPLQALRDTEPENLEGRFRHYDAEGKWQWRHKLNAMALDESGVSVTLEPAVPV